MIISVAGILTFSFLCKVAMLSARRSPPIKVGLLYFDLTSLIAELAYCEYADIMNACSVLSTAQPQTNLGDKMRQAETFFLSTLSMVLFCIGLILAANAYAAEGIHALRISRSSAETSTPAQLL